MTIKDFKNKTKCKPNKYINVNLQSFWSKQIILKHCFCVHHHFCCRLCSKFCEPSMLAKEWCECVSMGMVWCVGAWVWGC